MKHRGFEIAKGWENKNIHLPQRSTMHSAGYDIEIAEDVVIKAFKFGDKPTLVHTGIKAYFKNNEWLLLANRSSNPNKRNLILANGIGVIDSDYYNNETNDGEIMFAFYNIGKENIFLKKGEKIGQVIFQTFGKADNDEGNISKRKGGFGSTDKE